MKKLQAGVLVLVAASVLGCGSSEPANGTLACGTGSKPCPDGFQCDQGTNTCWKNGTGPDSGASGQHDAPAVDASFVAEVERPGEAGGGKEAPSTEAGALDLAPVDVRTGADAEPPDVPLSTDGDVPLAGTGGIIGTGGVSAAGGRSGTGGVSGSGGATGTGGVTGAGGTVGTGGTIATGGATGTGGTGTGGAPVDTTPPKVLSVTPANDTTGVLANAAIKITFSEAMNPASVESALTVSSLLSGDLTLTWSSGNTVLSIAAKAGFAYATGTTTTFAAKSYAVSLSVAAQDVAGNALSPTFTMSFKTMRRVTQTVAAEVSATYNTYAPSVNGSPTDCAGDSDGLFQLGKWTSSVSGGTRYVYVGFNTSTMGAPTTIEAADFIAAHEATDGDFYGTGGKVVLDKLAYQTVDDTILDAVVTSSIGTLVSSATVATPTLSILTPFRTDVLAGTQRQLYRLAPSGGELGTYAQFACAGFSFKTTYLMP